MSKKTNKKRVNENFPNVPDKFETVGSDAFNMANKTYDENKKKAEEAIKANEKLALETIPEEGYTGKKVTSPALKKMKLSEGLFEESLNEAVDGLSVEKLYDIIDMMGVEKVLDALVKYLPIETIDRFVSDLEKDYELDNDLFESLNESFYHYNSVEELKGLLRSVASEENKKDIEVVYSDLKQIVQSIKDGYIEEMCSNILTVCERDKNLPSKCVSIMETEVLDDLDDNNIFESLNEGKERGMQERLVSYLEKFMKYFKIDYAAMGEALMSIGKSFKTLNPMTEGLNESLEEIDRKLFLSLNKETKEPGVYYVLNDQNFVKKIYADSDEEAIEKFSSENLEESFKSKAIKEQLEKYKKGEMPKNWNPNTYLENLVKKNHITMKEAFELKEETYHDYYIIYGDGKRLDADYRMEDLIDFHVKDDSVHYEIWKGDEMVWEKLPYKGPLPKRVGKSM